MGPRCLCKTLRRCPNQEGFGSSTKNLNSASLSQSPNPPPPLPPDRPDLLQTLQAVVTNAAIAEPSTYVERFQAEQERSRISPMYKFLLFLPSGLHAAPSARAMHSCAYRHPDRVFSVFKRAARQTGKFQDRCQCTLEANQAKH